MLLSANGYVDVCMLCVKAFHYLSLGLCNRSSVFQLMLVRTV